MANVTWFETRSSRHSNDILMMMPQSAKDNARGGGVAERCVVAFVELLASMKVCFTAGLPRVRRVLFSFEGMIQSSEI